MRDSLRKAARDMLGELIHKRLEVELRRGDGRLYRVVLEENAEWYQKFCRLYHAATRKRVRSKFDTRIKRYDTIQGLKRIIAGKDSTEYTKRLMPHVKRYALETRRIEREQLVPF